MRWFWIDHFETFVRGTRASSIKCVTHGEEPVHSGVPGFPVFPPPLMIEGLAQTGGMLVGELGQFKERVVLAKVGKARFDRPVHPGERLRYATTLVSMGADGAMVAGTIDSTSAGGDERIGEVDLMFAQLDERFAGVEQFVPVDLLRMLRLLRLYDVGVDQDGRPLTVPPHLAAAERVAAGLPADATTVPAGGGSPAPAPEGVTT